MTMQLGVHLGQASDYVQKAVCKSVHDDVSKLIDTFMQSGMAAMFRNQAHQKLDDPQGRALTLKIVTNALAVEEKARAEEAARQNPPEAAKK